MLPALIAALSLAPAPVPARGAVARPAPPAHTLPPAGPPAAAGPDDPIDLATLSTVHLDVLVTDRQGRPVPGLTARDFTVTEADGPRHLESMSYRAATGTPSAGRVFGLLLDDYHVAPGIATARARAALTAFVDHDLRPDDSVVLMRPLDQPASLTVTQNRQAIRTAIDGFAGRLGDDTPRNAFERDFMGHAPAAVEAARAQTVLSALEALSTYLAGLPEGRKTLIFVSSGFAQAPTEPRLRLPRLDTTLRIAGRFDIAIYPLDPDPSDPAAAPPARHLLLRNLADWTGGTLIATPGDLAPALDALSRDADAYYLLTFRAPEADGRFHEISVKVARRGVQVRARPAYWVPSMDEMRLVREANRVRSEPAPKVVPIVPAHTSGFIRSWVGIAQGADGQARVTVTWEPNRDAVSHYLPVQADRVQLTATTPTGEALFRGPLAPVTGTAGPVPGAPSDRAVFDAPPGPLELSLRIEAGRQALDTDVRHVEVPAFGLGRLVLTPPEVFRTFTGREFDRLRRDPDATPVAAADFSRTARLLIRVHAYADGGAPPVVTATLLNLLGQPMQTLAPIAPPPGDPGVTQFDLPLAQFPPGNYTIAFTATAGHAEARSLLPLRIVG
ncbi:MAG: VWA domain-containing protein [Acidobacteriota bacterium]|nr:VWA domain-containing protein [Acidobacteriota bacterium]